MGKIKRGRRNNDIDDNNESQFHENKRKRSISERHGPDYNASQPKEVENKGRASWEDLLDIQRQSILNYFFAEFPEGNGKW